MQSDLYYRASGEFSPTGVVLALVTSFVCALVLATAYAYLILYIPIAGYITFILSAGFGLLLGVSAGAAMKYGKVRNRGVAVGVAVLASLVGFYVHWVVWTYAFLSRVGVTDVSIADLLQHPDTLWQTIVRINEVGSFRLRGTNFSGAWLWFFWIVEAALIFAPALLTATLEVTAPFCERCKEWCKDEPGLHRLQPGEAETVRSRAEAKDFEALLALGPAQPDAVTFFKLDLSRCPRCDHTNTLSVKSIQVELDDKGKSSERSSDLLEHLLLTPADVHKLRALTTQSAVVNASAASGSAL